MKRRFSLKAQTLEINQATIDLTKGSIVILDLANDGKISVTGQCTASSPFQENAVDYVKNLASQCPEVAKFLND